MQDMAQQTFFEICGGLGLVTTVDQFIPFPIRHDRYIEVVVEIAGGSEFRLVSHKLFVSTFRTRPAIRTDSNNGGLRAGGKVPWPSLFIFSNKKIC